MNQPDHHFNKAFKNQIQKQGLKEKIPDFDLIAYPTFKEELAAITLKILDLIEQGTLCKDMAVVYPDTDFGIALAHHFRQKHIPFYLKRTINLTKHNFFEKIIKLLQYAIIENDFPSTGDAQLFEILHFDFFNIKTAEIIELTMEARSKRYSSSAVSIRKLLFNKSNIPPKDLFEKSSSEALKNTSHFLENLLAAVNTTTVDILLEELFKNTTLSKYINDSVDTVELLQLKTAFLTRVKIHIATVPLQGSEAINNLLDLLDKNTPDLSIEIITGAPDNVRLQMAETPHQLNFRHIFYIGITNYFAVQKPVPVKNFTTIKTLVKVYEQQEKILWNFIQAAYSNNIKVQVTYAENSSEDINLNASVILASIIQRQQLTVQKFRVPSDQLLQFESIYFATTAPTIVVANEAYIAPILHKFSLSVSALNSFLQCPLSFYYQYILRIPVARNEYMEFGSAIHYALESLFKKMQDHKKNSFPTASVLVEDYYFYMHKNKAHFTAEAFIRRLKFGTTVLVNYYTENVDSWNKIVSVERNIQGVLMNGIPLKGKIDKLEFDGKEINVVDYKSGNIDKALAQLKPPHNNNPNGGNYWRQAVFYKILVDNYQQKNWTVVSTVFDFVEPDIEGNYRKEKILIEPNDIETVKQQITAVWTSIKARNFYTGCGRPNCSWCNFVKDNKLVVAAQHTLH